MKTRIIILLILVAGVLGFFEWGWATFSSLFPHCMEFEIARFFGMIDPRAGCA